MEEARASLLDEVASYYSEKLERHGETPQGVDWNGEEGQTLRFTQLCKIFTKSEGFAVNDIGCGYGALYDFLDVNFQRFSYIGIDVSEDMLLAAKRRLCEKEGVHFVLGGAPAKAADFGVASGIFNVRLGRSDSEWLAYLESTLDIMNETSKLGFSFNCLTSYSDHDKMRDYLYYADPCMLFDLCKRRYSRNVSVLHDYGLYEFTILVRKHL
jgi:SAM-dependent methyltransferase